MRLQILGCQELGLQIYGFKLENSRVTTQRLWGVVSFNTWVRFRVKDEILLPQT